MVVVSDHSGGSDPPTRYPAIGAIPDIESVGPDRIELSVMSFSDRGAPPSHCCRFLSEPELKQLSLQRLVFLDRLGDFSYIAVGPWLRDQLLRNADEVNERWRQDGGPGADVGATSPTPVVGNCAGEVYRSSDGRETDVPVAERHGTIPFFLERIRVGDVVGADPGLVRDKDPAGTPEYWSKHGGF